ncbi:hypothetical protein BS78_03G142700 [Paspalum vaginatum]|nr:hypothetical protein BS78_03G142700 [Paspalum vaginatum]
MAKPLTIDDLAARLDDLTKIVTASQQAFTISQQETRKTLQQQGDQLKRLSATVARMDPASTGKGIDLEDDLSPPDGSVVDQSAKAVISTGKKPASTDDHVPPSSFHDDYFHPRAKLEFPIYDGREDPLSWLNRCETFFRGQHTADDRSVWYASLHMTGPAQLWYLRLELNSGVPPWRSFVRMVQNRFGPPMTDTPLGALKLLQRTSTVEDYCEKFMALACRDAELSEQQQIQLFIAGLRNPLQIDVSIRRPHSLNEAITLARAYEQRMLLPEVHPPRPNPRASYRLVGGTASSVNSGPSSSVNSGPSAALQLPPVDSSASTTSQPLGST